MRVAKIFVCTGGFGSGKSNFASFLGYTLGQQFGCPVWANYSLHGSTPIYTVDELYRCGTWRDGGRLCGVPGVIVLDELHDSVDSRASSTKKNAAFLHWFMQSRKQQSDIIFMTQVLDQVDLRVRRMVSAEFCFEDRGGDVSKMDTWKIDLNGQREKKIKSGMWDRSLAFGLYDHLERAWMLESIEEKEAAGKVRAGKSAADAVAQQAAAVLPASNVKRVVKGF